MTTHARQTRSADPDPVMNRRGFLAAMGGVAAVGVLAACGSDEAPRRLLTPDLSGSEPSVSPRNDLFRHVNGEWLRTFTIPADKASFSTFDQLSDEAQQQLRQIVESIGDSATGDDAKIRDLYRTFMDTGAVNAAGVRPVQPLLDAISAAPTKADLTRGLAALSNAGGTGIVEVSVAPDQKDPSRYVATMVQSGIGLPDESYYREASYAQIRQQYVTCLTTLARLAGLPDPAGVAARSMAVETAVARGHLTSVESRDATATYNPRTWTQFVQQSPGIEWTQWREGLGVSEDKLADLVVSSPKAMATAATVWAGAPIDDLRDYMRMIVLRSYSGYLADPFRSAKFDFFSRQLNGIQQQPERWKSGVALVDQLIGEALGRKYVAAHFSGSSKDDAKDLVKNLLEAYRRSFTTINWFSASTRAEALTKLSKINVKIGYPDRWRDYSELRFARGNLVESVRAGQTFESRRQLNKLGGPVDKSEWGMTPQTVNAYYDPTMNEIVFPAAILQTPFFSADAEPAVNYGGIGAVIGHEIGHGFDDQGSHYDGDGRLRDWWTPADRAAFTKKSDALIAQYNALVPQGLPPDKHVNGALTVGENLADLGGLSIALSAFGIAAQKSNTGDSGAGPRLQDVFLSWGRIWRGKDRPEALAEQLATDPHSPSEFRCNQVVRNLPAYYETFGVRPGDAEYLPEDQRVRIW